MAERAARRLRRGTVFLLHAALLGAPLHAALAEEPGGQDARWFGYAKFMYVTDDKKGGRPDQSTPGIGGKLGAESGERSGFRLRAALYTTQDLGLRSRNPRAVDAYMFDLDKTPYSLLGEAQLRHARGRTEIVAGRQEFFSPIVNSYDYRIIPNLFEGYTLINRDLPDTALTLAYLGRMSGLDGLVSFSEFRSMSQQAYTSLLVNNDGRIDARKGDTIDPSRVAGQRGVWIAGLVHEGKAAFQFWNFHGTDTLETRYVDGRLKQALTDETSLSLDAQAYRVHAIGKFRQYLADHGLNASYSLRGVKATLAHRPSGISLGVARNRYGGDRHTVTANGNWGGYPEFVPMPYLYAEKDGVSAIANSRLTRLTALIDLGTLGLKEHSLLLGRARIDLDEAILAGSDIRVSTLLYRAKLGARLSTRIALEARRSANARYDNEFATFALRYDF